MALLLTSFQAADQKDEIRIFCKVQLKFPHSHLGKISSRHTNLVSDSESVQVFGLYNFYKYSTVYL